MASPGIEPGSGASEALILSIVLRGQIISDVEPAYRQAGIEFKMCQTFDIRHSDIRHSDLFSKSLYIGSKYFYGYSQQYYAEKFSYHNNTTWA